MGCARYAGIVITDRLFAPPLEIAVAKVQVTLHEITQIFFDHRLVLGRRRHDPRFRDCAGFIELITMVQDPARRFGAPETDSGARVERVPADQFNHCVAALRKPDGSYELLDPTWIPKSIR